MTTSLTALVLALSAATIAAQNGPAFTRLQHLDNRHLPSGGHLDLVDPRRLFNYNLATTFTGFSGLNLVEGSQTATSITPVLSDTTNTYSCEVGDSRADLCASTLNVILPRLTAAPPRSST